jgi:hypothetical protein
MKKTERAAALSILSLSAEATELSFLDVYDRK